MTRRHALVAGWLAFGAACIIIDAIDWTQDRLDAIVAKMAKEPLALNPVLATEAGYHSHAAGSSDGAARGLDDRLGDFSANGIEEQLAAHREIVDLLNPTQERGPDRIKTNGERWVDFGVIENRLERAEFQLETERPFARDPGFVIDHLRRGLLGPLALDYAPGKERLGHVLSRLEEAPDFLATAKSNLESCSPVHIEAAILEARVLSRFIRIDLENSVPRGLMDRFKPAAKAAGAALDGYTDHLEGIDADADWRIGAALFERKMRIDSHVNVSLAELEERIAADFDEAGQELIAAARALDGGRGGAGDFALVRRVLADIAADSRLPSGDETLHAFERAVEDAKAFIQREEAAPLPSPLAGELDIRWTPAFLRSIVPARYFRPRPLLGPPSSAAFWITPPEAGATPPTELELKLLAIDVLARFIQATLSAELENSDSRLLRNIDPNRSYTLGWPWRLLELMMAQDYAASPQLQLAWRRYKVGLLARALLDIRLHTGDLSLDDARTLLERRAFLDPGAVDAAVRELQLTPTDAVMAWLGVGKWRQACEFYQETTTDFSLMRFHDRTLRAGPMPVVELTYLATEGQDWIGRE